ncbi:MAG: hypothetical protein OQK94_01050 [Gammaproteobacteria bacterium]|nr:hypothetical protein [Gammaproteobacteria bacterium]MCW8992426.1 hypothetical protein [Gammaproteobacteria bacterium]
MCGGVYFSYNGEEMRVYFPNPKAVLPVQRKDGSVILLPWGRRKTQPGILPMGGWARLDSIHSGRWDKWFPVPVKLPIKSFMEKDIEGSSHWYDLTRGKFIQGLVAREGAEQRVYVVTVEPEMAEAVHERWPRVIS